jgi:enterochelin esterase family protein
MLGMAHDNLTEETDMKKDTYSSIILVLVLMGVLTGRADAAGVSSVKDVYQLLQNKKLSNTEEQQIADYALKRYKNDDLSKAVHKALVEKTDDGGGYAAWFIQAKPGAKATIVADKNRQWPMRELGKSGFFVAADRFPDFTSVHYRYTVDDFWFPPEKTRFGFESYTLGPMSVKQSGVPEGELIDMGTYSAGSKFFPGTKRKWWVYVPKQYIKSSAAKLLVVNDGDNMSKGDGNFCIVMDNMIDAKKMPVTIGVFISPGETKVGARDNRSNEYDTCTRKYADFLEAEILPQVYAKYNISKDAADHCIAGSSSGASCAFTAAWQRNDLFEKVISFVGSYADFRKYEDYPAYLGGAEKPSSEYGPYKTAHNYPGLIRKAPRKNIRVYLQDGRNDLDNQLGNWFLNNERMAAALAYSGYDYKFAIGDGMHSRQHGMSILPEIFEWIWEK